MEQGESGNKSDKKCCSERSFVTFMLFLGMANAYVMRTNMSVAIVAMVNHTAITQSSGHTPDPSQDGEFEWTYAEQGIILASFFYGYVVTQIPFGFLSKMYGGKHFLGWGMLLNSVAAFFVPLSARYGGAIGLGLVRFIQGLGEGPIVPCTHALLAHWIPPNERSRAGAAVYAGAQFGTIISMPCSGLLAEYGFDGGWPSIFYVFGACSTIWSVAFLCLISDNPGKSKRISPAELAHINESLWLPNEEKNPPTPFCSIAKAMPFWAIMFAHIGQNYGYETLMTELPTYMSKVLHVSLKANGFLSALPYVAMWLSAIVLSIFADCLISRRNVSITIVRKLMNSIGEYGPALALIAVSYAENSIVLSISLLTIGMALNGAVFSGFKINHLDLSPIFAGLLISITNCSANLIGLTAPMIAGHVINDDPSIENWRIVFFIAAAVFSFCATFYLIFASGKRRW